MPPTAIEPLSSVICNKTGGVMLFVTSFLKSLHEEQLIYFNLTTLRWEFDLIKITQKEVSSDILDFLSERIRRMPIKVQAGLRIASCLGSTFGFDVFRRAYKASDEATQEFISFAIGNGLLQEIDPNQYTWSHDQIYEAAYSLIKPDMRETTHLLVGTRIYLTAKDDEIMGLIHDIVRNMNVGMHLIETPEQKTELAQLNFMAGTKSKKSSAFFTASKYFLSGTQLLSDDWPESNYDLGMRLYNSA
jgi:predicted ATPase